VDHRLASFPGHDTGVWRAHTLPYLKSGGDVAPSSRWFCRDYPRTHNRRGQRLTWTWSGILARASRSSTPCWTGPVRRLHLLWVRHPAAPELSAPDAAARGTCRPTDCSVPVAERLLKAMREARPQTVRQFFAWPTSHMRWESYRQRVFSGFRRSLHEAASRITAAANRGGNNCSTRSPTPLYVRKRSAGLPQLLPEVRRRWRHMRAVDGGGGPLDGAVPDAGAPNPTRRRLAADPGQ